MAPLSKAEKQRLYRSRLNADPQRRQQYLEKKKQKYVADKLFGKRKSADSMTPREKRLQRKLWRSQQCRFRERKKHVQNILSPPQSPPEHELNDSQGERQRRQGRWLIARNRTALHRRNTKLQEALDQARKEVARYKMRYSRLKHKTDMGKQIAETLEERQNTPHRESTDRKESEMISDIPFRIAGKY